MMIVIVDEECQSPTDHADDERAHERRPKALDGETESELSREPAREGKQYGVDDEREQAERHDDERAGEDCQQWSDQRVHQTKDERDDDERDPGSFKRQSRNVYLGGGIERDGIDDETQYQISHLCFR